ncbi:hypothetical protein CKF54_06835 [Psittacicella hinzii]|uniref:Uncharacterized protein n=1 Tax=Psittacicella hinzii TaxID=2028575 RepID=A0A3A1Y2A3_9GAMM|nr:hypothetical protein CKF54_06835 [Psittacicella hinzii]
MINFGNPYLFVFPQQKLLSFSKIHIILVCELPFSVKKILFFEQKSGHLTTFYNKFLFFHKAKSAIFI